MVGAIHEKPGIQSAGSGFLILKVFDFFKCFFDLPLDSFSMLRVTVFIHHFSFAISL